ncbi:MAG: FAD-dependent oxidoreductase [Candidatus Muiribacteriota bacterium]|jgi:NADPH-dependent 2,4-dienoyl-CoA reductase/sulfur reductase-like enzyme
MAFKIIVIGANAAGLSAAMEAKRANPEYKIQVFDKSKYISYGACALPYVLSGKIDNYKKIFARSAEHFTKNGIEVFTESEVTEIDLKNKTVIVNNQEYPWDKLVIATGSSSRKLPFQKENYSNVFNFVSMEEALEVKNYIEKNNIKKVAVIGGGYIGIELLDVLTSINIEVNLIEMFRIMTVFDEEMLEPIYSKIKNNNLIKLFENSKIEDFIKNNNKITGIKMDNGETAECEMVIVSAGVIPNTELAQKAGIALGKTGAIKVNTKMQTNNFNVFSGGDCAEIFNSVTGDFVWIPLGTNANRAGKVIGRNLDVASEEVKILGASMLKIFDIEMGAVGLSETAAKKLNLNIETKTAEFTLKPPFISSDRILMKYVIDKFTRQLLGAQIVGDSEVHGKINSIAGLIYNKMKVTDIEKIDMGYHPLLSGVWDPIILMARKF